MKYALKKQMKYHNQPGPRILAYISVTNITSHMFFLFISYHVTIVRKLLNVEFLSKSSVKKSEMREKF